MKRSAPVRRSGLKPKRGTSTAALKRKATTLHSEYVRARDGGCVRCRRNGTVPSAQLQCAHIVSRRYAATRTKEWNACALCSACHRRLTEHPDEAAAWNYIWCKDFGEYSYEKLREIAYDGQYNVMRADFWREEISRLSGLLAVLDV